MTESAQKTLDALEEARVLTDEHALQRQIVLTLASIVDRGSREGKITVATVQAARQLQEATERLPRPEAMVSSEWVRLVEALRAAGVEVPQ